MEEVVALLSRAEEAEVVGVQLLELWKEVVVVFRCHPELVEGVVEVLSCATEVVVVRPLKVVAAVVPVCATHSLQLPHLLFFQ